MKLIDIGLNLFSSQFRDPSVILETAAKNEIGCILTGSDMKENRQIDAYPLPENVYGTAGIHPHNADRAKKADFEELREMLDRNPRFVAVGECGLDFDRMFSTQENQLRCLENHLELAAQTGLPLFLHERRASSALIDVFKQTPELCPRGVIHCFTGDRDTLETYLEMGFMIGITGWICDDRRAGALRDAVSILPPDRVMIETDAPYLTPRNVPGLDRRNVPWNLPYVLRDLARYMHMDEEQLGKQTLENTVRFFHLSK